jgi:hypothetical protein
MPRKNKASSFSRRPTPHASIFLAAANSAVRLARLANSAAMEDCNELFLEYRQGDRTADYCNALGSSVIYFDDYRC